MAVTLQGSDVRCVLARRTERAPVFPQWFFACHCLQMMAMGMSNSGTWHGCDTMDGTQRTRLMVWLHTAAKGQGRAELIEGDRKSGSWAKIWSQAVLTTLTVLCIMLRRRNLGQSFLCEGNEYLEECEQRSGPRKKYKHCDLSFLLFYSQRNWLLLKHDLRQNLTSVSENPRAVRWLSSDYRKPRIPAP